jgi:hypothetical protein
MSSPPSRIQRGYAALASIEIQIEIEIEIGIAIGIAIGIDTTRH